jgi:hypothetical protein
MGGTCGTHGGGEKFLVFWLGGPNVREQWEDLSVGGKIKLVWPQGDRDRRGELDSVGSR